MPHVLTLPVLTVLALVGACADPDELMESLTTTEAASTGAATEAGAGAPTVTYHRDVRPLLARHCLGCHQEGGIAPIALDSAAAAAAFAGPIAAATASRAMPPFPADNSGACHSFRDARWLTDAELATLATWAEEGAPAGDPGSAPAEPAPPTGLDGEVRTLAMAADYTPRAELEDDYRCFVVDPHVAASSFITGVAFIQAAKVYAEMSGEAAAGEASSICESLTRRKSTHASAPAKRLWAVAAITTFTKKTKCN